MKRVMIAGGTGFLGNLLSDHYQKKSYEVNILTRKKIINNNSIKYHQWDGKSNGEWINALEGIDFLINLNGKSVDCRYTSKNKQLIYNTRVDSTNTLGEAILTLDNPPKVWLNASSATIYRESYDKEMNEQDGELGDNFSEKVCKAWESKFNEFNLPNTRKIIMRIGIVLGKNAGPFIPLKNLAKIGMGGSQGSGNQYCSWIHELDFINSVDYLIDKNKSGIYNITSPNPFPNNSFMKELRKALNRNTYINLPKWLLEIGAVLIRTETELILKSRKVIPEKLIKDGFKFEYPNINEAFAELAR